MANNKRRARKDSYLSKRKVKNKRFLKMIAGLIVLSSVGFLYLNSSMNAENEKMSKDIISSQKKLEDVKTEIDGLKEDYEMRNTDQFKEKVAKEKLGMVKKDEVSEKPEEENSVIKQVDNTASENQDTTNQGSPENQADSPANTSNNINQNENQNSNPKADASTDANGR